MSYTLRERLPTAEQYNTLRAAVGWGTYDIKVAGKALPRSLYGIMAFDGDTPIGMARVIGDGGMVYYVQDVIVIPEYQRLGIGSAMMECVMDYVNNDASNNSKVGLLAIKGKEPFYEKFGFVFRPTETLGAGMVRFYKK